MSDQLTDRPTKPGVWFHETAGAWLFTGCRTHDGVAFSGAQRISTLHGTLGTPLMMHEVPPGNWSPAVPASRVAELEAEREAVEYAAHMPADYEHGLPSWINQRLYAAYIGLHFSDEVMEQINSGRLRFEDSPDAKRVAELRSLLESCPAIGRMCAQVMRPESVKPTAEQLEIEAWLERRRKALAQGTTP